MALAVAFYYTLLEELNTMLNKLFRPKWQHENPEIRKNAVLKLDKSEIDILEEIALHDKDSNVRQQVISKIEDLSLLLQLTEKAKSEPDRELALKCWVHTLTQSEQLSPIQIEHYILDCRNEKLLAGIIAYSENNSLKELALGGIKNEQQLLTLMQNTKNGRVWQAIIEKLSSEDAIKKASSIINGRDKKSQQAIKNKLDHLKESHLILKNQEKQTEHISNKLNHLLAAESNPLYEGILLTAKQQWQTLEKTASPEQKLSINSLITQCQQRLITDLQKKESLIQAELQQSKSHAAHKEILNRLNELKMHALANTMIIEQLVQEKIALSTQWHEIHHQPEKNQELAFNNLVSDVDIIIDAREKFINHNIEHKLSHKSISTLGFDDIRQLIDNLIQINAVFKKYDSPKNDFDILLDIATQHQKHLLNKTKNLHVDIKKRLLATEDLIERKELKTAQSEFAHTRKILSQLSKDESRKYNNAIQRILNSIKNLDDWKNYSNDEKRVELSERMMNLADTDASPLEKYETIQTIQQEWKALGHCQNQQLWEQFKSYADQAYAPCHAYFTEQKEIRSFNADQRRIICKQLESLLELQDWTNTDWKSLDRIYKVIQDEWQKYSPVERHEHQALQDRFFGKVQLLKEKINTERKNNTSKLMDIVAQAKKLLDESDIQKSIEDYARLQNEWKSVGITFHKQQHEHWQSFKKAGDELHQKRQNMHKQADHERQVNLSKAAMICDEIIRLSKLPDTELANSKNVFENLKSDFKMLGALPGDSFKRASKNFQDACHTYEINVKNISKRQWLNQFKNLALLGDEILTHELNGADYSSALSNALLPEKWIQKLQTRLQHEVSTEDQARILCIEIELLAGIDIPTEDSNLKMQWQISRLAKNFGQLKSESENEKIEDLYLRWFTMKCWNESSYRQLQQRFLNAGDIILNRQ